MCLDANLLAHIQDGTGGTMRKIAGANMFSERYQQSINFDPVTLGKFLLKRDHCLFGCGRLDISPAISHPVDMDVHADKGFAAGDAHHQMCTLGTDSRKGAQDFLVTWEFPVKVVNHPARQLQDLDCL